MSKRKEADEPDVIEIFDSSDEDDSLQQHAKWPRLSHAARTSPLQSQNSAPRSSQGHQSSQKPQLPLAFLNASQKQPCTTQNLQLSSSQGRPLADPASVLVVRGRPSAPKSQSKPARRAPTDQPAVSLSPQLTQQQRLSQLLSVPERPYQPQDSPAAGPSSAATTKQPRSLRDSAPWSEKHAPSCLEELLLAVQRKKALELQDWLESQLPHRLHKGARHLLIVTGPSGCCKSAAIRVLTQELGFEINEWTPPTPTTWSEHCYQGAAAGRDGARYSSKLDEFEMFASRAKYPPLDLGRSTAGLGGVASSSGRPKLVLIDDVPHAADAEARKRLLETLQDLATTARCPVILVTTESSSTSNHLVSGASAASGAAKGLHKDILSGLQAIGANIISFNAVTATNITKVLTRVGEQEGIQLPSAAVTSIASVADGDLRNAMQTLQLLYQRPAKEPPRAGPTAAASKAAAKKGSKAPSKRAVAAAVKAAAARPLEPRELAGIAQAQRDQGLQLFHVLGKVLYNKRDLPGQAADDGEGEGEEAGRNGAGAGCSHSSATQGGRRAGAPSTAASRARADAANNIRVQQQRAGGPGQWMSVVAEMSAETELPASHRRPPMRYDPEDLLLRSSLDPLGAVSFLHENYPSFIAEEAIDDVARAAAYLSDAGFLASFRGGSDGLGFSGLEDTPGSSVLSMCAGSVAARGLLFANEHPAPRRFLSMRGPAGNVAGRACEANRGSLHDFALRMARQQGTVTAGGSSQVLASQVLPHMRKLACAPSHAWLNSTMPTTWSHLWNGSINVVQSEGQPRNQSDVRLGGVSMAGLASDPSLTGLVESLSLHLGTGHEDEPIEDADGS